MYRTAPHKAVLVVAGVVEKSFCVTIGVRAKSRQYLFCNSYFSDFGKIERKILQLR